MKVSVKWLKELVAVDMTIDTLAHTLTMAGLEVEDISPVAAPFDRVVVAEVKSTAPHPNADKLKVCEVDAGTGTLLQIVCGAPNVAPGMRVPCALVGARLGDLEIKHAKLRGVESAGMLCSAKELGLSSDHSGLMPLAADAPVGQSIRDFLDLDDVYLTLKMTPNRGDCLSMVGIARDLAAVTGAPLTVPAIAPVPATGTDARTVTLREPVACGRYLGRVITGIDAHAATPDWMTRRLERAGFRAISPLVDITNYLTLERGRPMHAFDNDKLRGGIEVRYPRAGEEMNLLNAQHVVLQPDMLVIADDAGAVGLGGVMGGLESMCTEATTSVFFEAAYFDPAVIQGKTRTLGINSDAAYRFERGVDPASPRDGIEYATALTLAICGTPRTKVGPITEAVGTLPVRPTVRVRPSRADRLIGVKIPVAEMVETLRRLQCEVSQDGEELVVTPPGYRFDLTLEEDFIEEIARIHGYDRIPVRAPVSGLPMLALPESRRSRHALRHALAGMGYQEVINYSFTPPEWEEDLAGNPAPLKLANPIASQMSVMRSTLLGGLLATLQHNLNHGTERVKVFELGRVFLADEASVDAQPERLAGLAHGTRYPEQWGEGGEQGVATDFHVVKGEVEVLLAGKSARFERTGHPALHPGRAARILIGDKPVGILGELHPKWQQKLGLARTPVMFELDIVALVECESPRYQPISRMPTVRRNVALLLDDSLEIQRILDAISARKLPNIVEFAPFDVYHGQNLESGKKSVAFRIVMQDTDRTLTDSEADSKVSEILEVLSHDFGATLRK